ncbi:MULTISPECIES: hypothetical protein [unclassified Paenibacillus]|nr:MULTISPECIES: hypothetical protein [unclassified Paenibacillus]KGP77944.1 hypothetical protein P364_0130685 [Paenibacillus sp. MAEPY2]KGP81570.1 hypothetical protein P363_0127705 [Paenibacillus sp. MAEPY1]
MKQMFKRIFGSQAAKPPIEVEKIEVQMSEFNFEKYVPKTNTTIVYLPAIDFHSERFGRRPQ